MFQLARSHASAALDHALKKRNHGARGARTDDVASIGEILFQHVAFIVGDFSDVARLNAKAVIGKNGEGRSLLVERQIGGAQSHRQAGRNLGSHAETASRARLPGPSTLSHAALLRSR